VATKLCLNWTVNNSDILIKNDLVELSNHLARAKFSERASFLLTRAR